MKWLEVALRVDASLRDIIADVLDEYGYQGVAIERGGILPDKWDDADLPPATHYTIRAYFPQEANTDEIRTKLNAALAHFPVEPPVYRDVAEEDWAEAWKQHYHPIRLGKRIVVRPVWESTHINPDDIEIILDPGMAFGTGTHPTTQLCLQAIETRMPTGAHVLDLGCGSGILSIGAVKLGAQHVYAIDIDPVAVESAADNINRNHTTSAITLATGGLSEVLQTGETYDFAVVNILARIIIQMCHNGLGQVVKPGGTAIFSGVIQEQLVDLEAALLHTGLTPINRQSLGDWVLIEAKKDA